MKKVAWLVLSGVGLWVLVVSTGTRLSYFYTELSFQIRAFVLFPALLIFFFYLCFFYRGNNKETGYMWDMASSRNKKDKIKTTMWGLLGLIAIPAIIAWTSVAFPAWAANLLATEKYMKTYKITDIEVRRGAAWSALFDLSLIDPITKEVVILRLRRSQYEQYDWKNGDHICVQGRTSVFGTIVDATSMGVQSCVEV